MTQDWEVFAVRYATRATRRQDVFLRYYVYDEPDGPQQLDYYFWVLRGPDEVVLVDTGIDVALRRPGREVLIDPLDALRALDIGASEVSRVIVSHCHSDHIGGLPLFPEATAIVQRRELEFWNSPTAAKPQFASTVQRSQIDHLTEAVARDRAAAIEGDAALGDGLAVRLVGGHSAGHQIVTARTASGDVVLPSDAMHFYEELDRERPFSVLWNLAEVYQTYDLLNALRDSGAVLVPGHDAEVMRRFAAVPRSEHIARIG